MPMKLTDEEFGNLVEASKKFAAFARVLPRGIYNQDFYNYVQQTARDLEYDVVEERNRRLKEATQ